MAGIEFTLEDCRGEVFVVVTEGWVLMERHKTVNPASAGHASIGVGIEIIKKVKAIHDKHFGE